MTGILGRCGGGYGTVCAHRSLQRSVLIAVHAGAPYRRITYGPRSLGTSRRCDGDGWDPQPFPVP